MLLIGGGLEQFKGRKLSACFHVLVGITHLFDRWMRYLIHSSMLRTGLVFFFFSCLFLPARMSGTSTVLRRL